VTPGISAGTANWGAHGTPREDLVRLPQAEKPESPGHPTPPRRTERAAAVTARHSDSARQHAHHRFRSQGGIGAQSLIRAAASGAPQRTLTTPTPPYCGLRRPLAGPGSARHPSAGASPRIPGAAAREGARRPFRSLRSEASRGRRAVSWSGSRRAAGEVSRTRDAGLSSAPGTHRRGAGAARGASDGRAPTCARDRSLRPRV